MDNIQNNTQTKKKTLMDEFLDILSSELKEATAAGNEMKAETMRYFLNKDRSKPVEIKPVFVNILENNN